jgi:hypothetical protein
MTVPTPLRWLLLALAGLLVAVAVAVLASKLTSQRIGLSSEPLEAGQTLAPPEHGSGDADGHRPSGDRAEPSTTTTTTTTASEPTTTTTASDETGEDGDSGEETSDDD